MSYRNAGAARRFAPYARRSDADVRLLNVDWRQLADDYTPEEVEGFSSYVSEVKKERVTVWICIPSNMDPYLVELEARHENNPEVDYLFWLHDEVPPTFVRGMKSVILVSNSPKNLKKMFTVAREFDADNIELSLICKKLSDVQKEDLEKDLHHHVPFYWPLDDSLQAITEHLKYIGSTEKWQRMSCDWNRKQVLVFVTVEVFELDRGWRQKYEFSEKYHYFFPHSEKRPKARVPAILVSDSVETIEIMYAHLKTMRVSSTVTLALIKECTQEEKERLETRLDGHVPMYLDFAPEFYDAAVEFVLEEFEKKDQEKEARFNSNGGLAKRRNRARMQEEELRRRRERPVVPLVWN